MNKEQAQLQEFGKSLNDNDFQYMKSLNKEYLDDFDPENKDTYFTEQDYANLQRNLVLFKQGDREATEYIVKAFHRTIHAYTDFIVLQKLTYYTVTNYKTGIKRTVLLPSLSRFINLFTKNRTAKEMYKNAQAFKDTCSYIYFLFNKYEYGDIYNELVLALISMANKYKIITDKNDYRYKPNGTFHIYVKKCFHFEAFHFLKKLANDPLLKANLLSVSNDIEDFYEDEDNTVFSKLAIDEQALFEYDTVIDCLDRKQRLENSNLLTLKEDDIDIYSDEALNFNWISGAVCGPIFKSLTPYERELLILSYSKNQTEDTLASLFNCSRSTIGSHKRKAIKKLKEAIANNKEENNDKIYGRRSS